MTWEWVLRVISLAFGWKTKASSELHMNDNEIEFTRVTHKNIYDSSNPTDIALSTSKNSMHKPRSLPCHYPHIRGEFDCRTIPGKMFTLADRTRITTTVCHEDQLVALPHQIPGTTSVAAERKRHG